MAIMQLISIAGCFLAAIHVAFSFPMIVNVANSQLPALYTRKMHLWSGLLMYCCWGIYGYFVGNYLLAFALVLGILKYAVVLIQLAINIIR